MMRRHTLAGSGGCERFVGTLGAILLAIILGFHAHPRVAGAAFAGGNGKTDGPDQQWLAAASGSSGSPAWSPDGTRIVFSSDRSDGNLEIYVMDADGSNVTRLTYDAATDHEPVWSPDGTAILFYTDRNGDFEIFVMNADGSDQAPITSDLHLTHTDSADPIEVGDSLTYPLTVSTLSPAPATDAAVTDSTPSNTINGTTPVATITTTTTLDSTPNPSIQSQQVTLTATVAPATATGVVTFYDGPAVVGIRPLINGQAALTTTLLPAGTRSLTALYGGDAGHLPNRSDTRLQTVQAAVQDSFHPAVAYDLNTDGRAVAVADFDGDARADLAVAVSGGLSVLRGNGDGTFQPAVAFGVSGDCCEAIAVGDFNADARSDVAVAGRDAVVVRLGTGTGTFGAPVQVSDDAEALTTGDVNNDGRIDLVATDTGEGTISVLLGNGNGTFQPLVSYAMGEDPSAAVLADFNGDGNVDVAVANSADVAVHVRLGTGLGFFQALQPFNIPGLQGLALEAYDFNRDGNQDLIVTGSGTGRVHLLIGAGTGGFSTVLGYPNGSLNSRAIAVADFFGDTFPDLATANNNQPGNVNLLSGLPGVFLPTVTYQVGTIPLHLAAGDFNGDGGTDLAVADAGTDDIRILVGRLWAATSTTLVGTPNPSTQSQTVTLTATVAPSTATGMVTFYDGPTVVGIRPLVNGQAVLTTTLLPAGIRALTALYGSDAFHRTSRSPVLSQTVRAAAQESFHPAVSYGLNNDGRGVTVGDFNGDARADLAVALDAGLGVMRGNGDGSFQPVVKIPASQNDCCDAIATGDFNADGRADLVVAGNEGVDVLLGTGAGAFGAAVNVSATAAERLALGDLDNDGRIDLIAIHTLDDTVSVQLGIGNGTFQPPVTYAMGVWPTGVVLADFNRDGKVDVAVANQEGVAVHVRLGTGTGTLGAAMPFNIPGQLALTLAAHDFNRDGNPDLVVAGRDTGNVHLLLGNGTGTFPTVLAYPTGSARNNAIVVADLFGDTFPDLATANQQPFNVTTLSGVPGAFLAAVRHQVGTIPQHLAAGDFNGDGGTDLVVTDAGTDDIRILLGTAGTTRVDIATNPAGRSIVVDGTTFTGPRAFYWFPNSVHTIGTASPQSGNLAGTRHLFANWSDGGAITHSVTATSAPATYTATFTLQYLLETSVLPAGGGSITASPASPSGFYDPGTIVQLTATATAGYTFTNWLGSLSGSSANPQSVTMAAPRAVVAEFTPPSCAANVTSQLNISPGGLQRTITGRWMQGVTISNRNGTPIVGPLALALDGLSSGVALFDPSGFTACALPAGRPFRSISVGADGVLSPGEIVNVTLEFTNPLNLRISYTPRALAGPNR